MNALLLATMGALIAVAVCGPFPEGHPDDMMYPGQGRRRLGGPGGPDAPYGPGGPGSMHQVGRPGHYVEPQHDQYS